MARSLSTIAREIRWDYDRQGKPVYYAAKPYVDAMETLHTMDDAYYDDDAESVVAYALSNLSYWRGDTAKRVKAELKAMLKERSQIRSTRR